MAQTVRRRFQRVLRGRVRESVESSDAVEPEIQSLIEILGDVGAAGSA